ncbi:MAG: hypothetical protein S4CHLAM20_11240 [Chlamydiia bacterium]|nr:hypothetical protein [Chlamydiia bacterium]
MSGYYSYKKIASFYYVVFLCMVFSMPLEASKKIKKRDNKEDFTTSIIIPCHHLHAQYLMRLCESYIHQTYLPNEIVISLSGCRHLNDDYVNKLLSKEWPFKVKCIKSDGLKSEPQNRNIAAEHASGEILICQDADDLPLKERVEVIKYFFDEYDIVHLMHQGFLYSRIEEKNLYHDDLEVLLFYSESCFEKVFKQGYYNGPVAITKSLFKKIRWDDNHKAGGSDVKFNRAVYKQFHNVIQIPQKLYIYYNAVDSIYTNHNL